MFGERELLGCIEPCSLQQEWRRGCLPRFGEDTCCPSEVFLLELSWVAKLVINLIDQVESRSSKSKCSKCHLGFVANHTFGIQCLHLTTSFCFFYLFNFTLKVYIYIITIFQFCRSSASACIHINISQFCCSNIRR